MAENLPYLTAGLPGIGGRIKDSVEDFRVEEVPLYSPCGKGTHLYFRVDKAGIPTPTAIERIARHMGVPPSEIGVAGLKDAKGLTSQMMSLEHADAARLAGFRDSQVKIEPLGLHGNKLRPGHLAGNRFIIRIRGAGADRLADAQAVLDILIKRGTPNYFGPQRFGARGETAQLGKALVKGDLDEFLAIFLGRGSPDDPPDCRSARDAFDAGFLDRALQRWPRHYANERRALAAYKRSRKPAPAIAAIDKRMRRLYVSALQSAIFNEVLVQRIETLDRIVEGDLARKEDNGAIFPVVDAAAEQGRAERFEISPTGPIVGYRGNLAGGAMGKIEQGAIARWGVSLDDFRRVGTLKVKGGRRALRFALNEAKLAAGDDNRGPYLELAFTSPPGCYATVVLREIMKSELLIGESVDR